MSDGIALPPGAQLIPDSGGLALPPGASLVSGYGPAPSVVAAQDMRNRGLTPAQDMPEEWLRMANPFAGIVTGIGDLLHTAEDPIGALHSYFTGIGDEIKAAAKAKDKGQPGAVVDHLWNVMTAGYPFKMDPIPYHAAITKAANNDYNGALMDLSGEATRNLVNVGITKGIQRLTQGPPPPAPPPEAPPAPATSVTFGGGTIPGQAAPPSSAPSTPPPMPPSPLTRLAIQGLGMIFPPAAHALEFAKTLKDIYGIVTGGEPEAAATAAGTASAPIWQRSSVLDINPQPEMPGWQGGTAATPPPASPATPPAAANPTPEEMAAGFKPDEARYQAAEVRREAAKTAAKTAARAKTGAWENEMADRIYAKGQGINPLDSQRLTMDQLDQIAADTTGGRPKLPLASKMSADTILRMRQRIWDLANAGKPFYAAPPGYNPFRSR